MKTHEKIIAYCILGLAMVFLIPIKFVHGIEYLYNKLRR